MMSKKEYLVRLRTGLGRLPKEEADNIIAYYEEYFDEAGPENEQAVIEELGGPREVAGKVIAELAVRYMKEPEHSPKKRMKGVWIGVLAVLASPIALPLALAAVMVLFAMLMAAGAVAFAIVLAGAGAVVYSITGIFVGLYYLIADTATGIAILGTTAIAMGISMFLVKGGISFGRWAFGAISSFIAKLLSRRRRV